MRNLSFVFLGPSANRTVTVMVGAKDVAHSLVSLPYSRDINDKPAFEQRHRTASEFQEMICRQFDVLYREGEEPGQVMAIAIHPYLTNSIKPARALLCRPNFQEAHGFHLP